MEDADYWRDQAKTFRDRARDIKDREQHKELIELAAVCEEVADAIEAHAPSG